MQANLEVYYAIGGWDEVKDEPVGGWVKIGDARSLREANRLARRLFLEWRRRHGPGEVVVTQTRYREVGGCTVPDVQRVPEEFLDEVEALAGAGRAPWLQR
jgi:hypothetical protein